MLNICASGNFSFLNHLTIVPSLACLDDACWPRRLRALLLLSPRAAAPPPPPWAAATPAQRAARLARRGAELGVFGVILWLSWPVVANLLQLEGRQQMNASFGSFRLVNTYGAFGKPSTSAISPPQALHSVLAEPSTSAISPPQAAWARPATSRSSA
jgi:hypothetical protein